MKPGDPVRYRHSNGSTGRIEAENGYGGFYVLWSYGKDRLGEQMHARSSVPSRELMPATEDELKAIENREGFGSTGRVGVEKVVVSGGES